MCVYACVHVHMCIILTRAMMFETLNKGREKERDRDRDRFLLLVKMKEKKLLKIQPLSNIYPPAGRESQSESQAIAAWKTVGVQFFRSFLPPEWSGESLFFLVAREALCLSACFTVQFTLACFALILWTDMDQR
jgi:hypothetical protein